MNNTLFFNTSMLEGLQKILREEIYIFVVFWDGP